MQKEEITRPLLESLACPNPKCDLYNQQRKGNLIVRKIYGLAKIRYLRCQKCREEFSERKNTPLWNSKIKEEQAVAIAEHLAEGCSQKSTARLVKVAPSTVRRLTKRLGEHGQRYHHQKARQVKITELQADERYGFVGQKGQACWEAELFDPHSKFVLAHQQGERNEALLRALFQDGVACLADPHQLALFTDGYALYKTLFPEFFGRPYWPPRQGERGRYPAVIYRIPHTAAHVQIVKHHSGKRLTDLTIHYAHGSQKRIALALARLGYNVPNTSAIERRNATARLMSAAQVRKSLAFAKRSDTKLACGWWGITVYNWCWAHRSLQQIGSFCGKKSGLNEPRPWLLA